MEEGTIVLVNYTGRIAGSNTVFDTTIEKKAIEAGIFNEKQEYKPMPVAIGSQELLKGLDDALKEMKVEEQREIKVQPKQAFGERDPKLVAVVPLREFRRKNMQPVPGLIVDLDGKRGKVQSVSGGRVRVDFNHPLAGKELVYEIKIEKIITEQKEQIEALFEKYFGVIPKEDKKIVIKEDSLEISINPKFASAIVPLKEVFSKLITKNIKEIKTVKFVEEFKEEK